MLGRLFKIDPNTYQVSCGSKMLTDTRAEYPEETWREEGAVDELLRRGFLVEVEIKKKEVKK